MTSKNGGAFFLPKSRLRAKLMRAYRERKAVGNSISYRSLVLLGKKPETVLRVPQFGLETRIFINPMRIQGTFGKQHRELSYRFLITGGDWDLNCSEVDVESKMKYKTIDEIVKGVPLERTTEYLRFAEQLKKSNKPGKSMTQQLEYMESLKTMYETVLSEGAFDLEKSIYDPLKIAITREGKPVKMSNGNHRLALARYGRLKSIPVTVRLIHPDNLSAISDTGNLIADLNKWLKKIEAENRD